MPAHAAKKKRVICKTKPPSPRTGGKELQGDNSTLIRQSTSGGKWSVRQRKSRDNFLTFERAEISLIFRESAQTELLFPTAFFAGRGPREPKHSRATKISLAQSEKYGRDRHAQETARYVRNTAAAQSSLSSALTPHDCGDGAARRGP